MTDVLFAEHPVVPSPPISLPSSLQATIASQPADSTVAVADSPPDPNTIPIRPPNGTPPPPTGHLLPEVEMAEASQDVTAASHASSTPAPADLVLNGVNSVHSDDDHPAPTVASDDGATDMNVDIDDAVPLATATDFASSTVAFPSADEQPMSDESAAFAPPVHHAAASSPGQAEDANHVYGVPNGNASTGSIRAHPDSADDDGQPPAKRARKLSDPDVASLNHTASPSTTLNDDSKPFVDSLVTQSAPGPATEHSGPSTLTPSQHRFILSTIRSLKRVKEAAPFLAPVDPVALNIPHYPAIVKNPMDLGTIERKVAASSPTRPDPNAAQGRYHSAAEFIADVQLIFHNCLIFNGPEHPVTLMGKRVEAIFEKQIKNLPSSDEVPVKKESSLPPAPAPIPPKKRKSSSANTLPPPPAPAARRLSDPNAAVLHRPKREVHPPAPRDVGYSELPKRTRVKKGKDDGTADQLKFCSKLISELFKKQYWSFVSPFYEPVDWQKLEIPSYPKIIKKPMDLTTMKQKLDRHEYSDALKFYADFKLMIRNCFTFNPAGTPVNNAGHQLSDLFEEKWKSLPPLREAHSDNDEFDDEFDEDSDDEHDGAIQSLTQQLESVKSNIAALQSKKKKRKEEKRRTKVASAPTVPPKASSSRSMNGSSGPKKKGKSKAADVDEVLSFEQKRELSETISTLEGAKLERVIQIIYEGVPEIRDSQDQIELDIDTLPSHVLIKLYNTVMRPIKPKPGGRGAGQRNGTGTGGLKRKSMDEEAEAERIRLLEKRIELFDKHQNGDGAANGAGAFSSDSSDSDSSGSDSD